MFEILLRYKEGITNAEDLKLPDEAVQSCISACYFGILWKQVCVSLCILSRSLWLFPAKLVSIYALILEELKLSIKEIRSTKCWIIYQQDDQVFAQFGAQSNFTCE